MDNKLSKAVLVGIAGSNNAFSLSIYNLKSFAYNDPEIRDKWDISIIQHPLINVNRKDMEVLPLIDRIVNAKPDLVGFSCYMWNVNVFDEIAQALRKRIPVKIIDFDMVFPGKCAYIHSPVIKIHKFRVVVNTIEYIAIIFI